MVNLHPFVLMAAIFEPFPVEISKNAVLFHDSYISGILVKF